MISDVRNIDCIDFMKEFPDGFFELAIVDVPYGIDAANMSLGEGGGLYRAPKTFKRGDWDKSCPSSEYWSELLRVSKNRVIWGANHFISHIPFDSPCWIVWDKNNGGSDFADCELAYTSFTSPVRIFKYTWSGFIQGNMARKEAKIHPTQKPIRLYHWLLQNYAKQGDKILDTHLGSGSSWIAANKNGFDFYGCEIDKDYYDASCERFKKECSMPLFDQPQPPQQLKLF